MAEITNELKQEIIEMRKQGKTIKELCNIFCIPYQEMKQFIKGIEVSGKCKYCGNKAPQYRDICCKCSSKRKVWRELHALACHIKELADKERLERNGC